MDRAVPQLVFHRPNARPDQMPFVLPAERTAMTRIPETPANAEVEAIPAEGEASLPLTQPVTSSELPPDSSNGATKPNRIRRRRSSKPVDAAELAGEIARLGTLSRADLLSRWQAAYGVAPPPRLGRLLLIRSLAHHLQEEAFGGLRPVVRRRLARLVEDRAAGKSSVGVSPSIRSGTRLLREWQGSMHEVIILEDGVQYRGQHWRSLSAVARQITGARWSGPRFFGLKDCSDA